MLMIVPAAAKSKTKVIAHRGYWNCDEGGHARNSFAAFKAAAQAGFWGTEFDINMTADGELLVFHDEVIDGKRIDQTNYQDLKDYRLENGEPIPTLDEFLEYASAQKTFPMLVFELKGHITEELLKYYAREAINGQSERLRALDESLKKENMALWVAAAENSTASAETRFAGPCCFESPVSSWLFMFA